jgi:hypothetical protein
MQPNDLIASLAAQTGVPAHVVKTFAEAVASRMEKGMSMEDAIRDHQATQQRMAEDVFKAEQAWRYDREHNTNSPSGDAFKGFLFGMIDELKERA